MRLASLLLLAAFAVGGCRTVDAPVVPLAGTTWRLAYITATGDDYVIEDDSVPPDVLTFDAEGRGVHVTTCNQCAGLYVVGDRTLEITRLACTRRACPDGRLELDRYLAGRSRWRLEGDRLVLTVNDRLNGIDATTLVFRRAED